MSGAIDEALKLHEKVLDACKKLGNEKGRAITLGDIARINADRGQIDQAIIFQQERLDIYKKLGDVEGQANALWNLAQINLAQGEITKAVERLNAAYQIVYDFGHLLGISQVGWSLGCLLCSVGAVADGQAILERSLAGFRHLRQEAMAQKVEEFLANLPPGGEDADAPP